ncbi:two-component sensor histidine kinase [Caldichromatium japonicum]|uniref:histidine kinase n=1 Tax=Caldichromatium japonicum TaxID=2699430 RepID=A0A6G7VAM3_9GAMM|nr:ATP-binding protein [Caldichromatium japonicum]QIK37002.1 two-component sensor histidine kinase [Caldichromatium japonicum]
MEPSYPSWSALRWLFLFRLLMVIGLVLAFSPALTDPAIAHSNIEDAWNLLLGYASLVLASGFGLSLRWPTPVNQVQLALFVDILTYTLLMHTAGGVTSGLGLLLAVSVATAALLLDGRLSLLFAAFSSLAVISEQLYSALAEEDIPVSFTQAGLLGLVFFAVAWLAHVLYQRVRSAEALAEQRQIDLDNLAQLNEFIIQSMGTGILVTNGAQRVKLINAAARDLLGGKEILAGTDLSMLAPEIGTWLAGQNPASPPSIAQISIANRELRVSCKRLGGGRSSGLILYLCDSREAEREAQRIKLASLGTLTASIAHNIRNPLSAISHAAQLLSEGAGLSEEDRYFITIIQRNSARIEETVRSVLTLSRNRPSEPQWIDLAEWCTAFVADFREQHQLSPDDCWVTIDERPLGINMDPRHLHQIIANLCENALVHGQAPGEPPRIQLRLRRLQAPPRIYLEICDQGPGIDPARAREIFNPFFTTKTQGIGLGLYIARELAMANGIQLTYTPALPRGSCFCLIFGRDLLFS